MIIHGGGGTGVIQSGTSQAVDPLFQAARIALRPLDYTGGGATLGHYSVAQKSGALVATIGAAGHLASIRWPSSLTTFCVPLRIKAGWTVSGAITAAVSMDLRAIIARAFTTDFTTASTPSTPSKMRATMGASLMGAVGPRISTTAVMSGQTLTADADAFAVTNWTTPVVTGAVTVPVGISGNMQTLYEASAAGQHPVVLAANEGIIIQPLTAGPASGTYNIYVEWTWAEVMVF